MNRLLRFVCPLIAGKKNCVPEATLPKPPEFWDTLMGETPGDSDSSCVKLRPFSGRSKYLFSANYGAQFGCRLLQQLARCFHRKGLLHSADLQGNVNCSRLVHGQTDSRNL